MEPILVYCFQMHKNMEKTVKNYEIKLTKVVNKMENFVIFLQN